MSATGETEGKLAAIGAIEKKLTATDGKFNGNLGKMFWLNLTQVKHSAEFVCGLKPCSYYGFSVAELTMARPTKSKIKSRTSTRAVYYHKNCILRILVYLHYDWSKIWLNLIYLTISPNLFLKGVGFIK